MRNCNHDGSLIIPHHLQAKFEAVTSELHEASHEFHRVEKIYREAILARLALTTPPESSPEWEALIEELQAARKWYQQAVVARVAITQEINTSW